MLHIELTESKQEKHMNTVTKDGEHKAVKRAFYEGMRNNQVKQDIVASVLNLNQSSISRMVNPDEYAQLSVGELSVLHKDPFTAVIADHVLSSIGGHFYAVSSEVDGSLLDEFLELTSIDGKLATILEDGVQQHEHAKILKLADRLEDIAMRLRTELQNKK